MTARSAVAFLATAVLFVARGAAAEGDVHYLAVHAETRADLFRRAALPAPGGAIVGTETLAPIRESVLVRAADLDTPLGPDTVDFEIGGWGLAVLPDDAHAQSPDGDVQSAYVRLHEGPVSVRLGRQVVAGGAARYARFDGGTVEATLESGFAASAYAGLTALPRWAARPAYYNLGASSDVALRDPAGLPPGGRSGYVLGGGRVGWSNAALGGQLSFHEQRDAGELSHRSLGADAQVRPLDALSFSGDAILELDAGRLSTARFWADVVPATPLDLSFELRHSVPSLLLSRTSVLSVFSTSAYDEAGGEATLRVLPLLTLDASGFAQVYDGGRAGMRSEVSAKVVSDRERRTLVRLAHARLVAPENGYHSARASYVQRIRSNLTGTLEAYLYLYDRTVLGRRASALFTGTLGFRPARTYGLLLAGSIAETPFAALDAQASVQLTCDFDLSGPRRAP